MALGHILVKYPLIIQVKSTDTAIAGHIKLKELAMDLGHTKLVTKLASIHKVIQVFFETQIY